MITHTHGCMLVYTRIVVFFDACVRVCVYDFVFVTWYIVGYPTEQQPHNQLVHFHQELEDREQNSDRSRMGRLQLKLTELKLRAAQEAVIASEVDYFPRFLYCFPVHVQRGTFPFYDNTAPTARVLHYSPTYPITFMEVQTRPYSFMEVQTQAYFYFSYAFVSC